ncbi:MAG: hypothetical protein LBD10_05805 [Desulfobulbus sp.]|jgi:hypothetical protein|uniref:hypothetical protein n=1 Tax=Desulfobulbus sp. TaxID=895 RepID=UPI00283F984F|nr:hypothetical protein [Desulfobulbus sp.]MDR2549695.1 hypothetical protein [Desulfobulbus sp.]
MKRQNEMMASFAMAHREFMSNLESSIGLLEKDIDETVEMESLCTDEWCMATEHNLDELTKMIYSISEPRWITDEDSRRISNLRRRIHDLYARYRSVRPVEACC